MSSKDNNPGNFANRPHEKVVEAARKGGHASHSGRFASMDAEKQVLYILHFGHGAVKLLLIMSNTHLYLCFCVWLSESVQHDIASKGGHASTGQFEAGSERAREAGRKDGRASGDGGGGGGSIDDDEADAGDNTQDSRTE